MGVSIAKRFHINNVDKLKEEFFKKTEKIFKSDIQAAVEYLTNASEIQKEDIKGCFGLDWRNNINLPDSYFKAVHDSFGENAYDTTYKDSESQAKLAKWPFNNQLTGLMEIYTPSYASKKEETKQYISCFELGAAHCHAIETADEIRKILWKDFLARDKENSNRAPYIINVPLYSIIDYSHVIIALDQFLDMALNLGDDVWILTVSQMINWIKSNQTELDRLREFEGFNCKDIGKSDKLVSKLYCKCQTRQ